MLSLPIEHCLHWTNLRGGSMPSKKIQCTLSDGKMCVLSMVVYPCSAPPPGCAGCYHHQGLEKEKQDRTISGTLNTNLNVLLQLYLGINWGISLSSYLSIYLIMILFTWKILIINLGDWSQTSESRFPCLMACGPRPFQYSYALVLFSKL